MLFLRPCHPESRPDRPPVGKRRPASHSYLPQREPLVVATIFSLCVLLVYVGLWLVKLLGNIPWAH